MIPPVLLAAGLGTAAVVTYLLVKSPAAPAAPAAPVMSPALNQAFQTLLAGTDPDAMEASATALEPFGFLAQAAQLRARAAVLRKTPGAALPAPTPTSPALGLPAAPGATVVTTTCPPGMVNLAAAGQPADCRALGVNPTAAVDPNAAAAAAAQAQLQAAADAAKALLLQAQVNPASVPPGALPTFATVTTSSPAPAGDLMIRPAPNADGTPGVGAEKNGIVTVIKQDALGDGVWSQVVWAGGQRLGPAAGFVKTEFLRPSLVGPLGTSTAGDDEGQVRCIAPSGCRLRKAPSAVADFRAIVGHGESVNLCRLVRGPKMEERSPGKGGWALVKYKNLQGWLPAEWLVQA